RRIGALSVADGVSPRVGHLIHHPSTVDCATSLQPIADINRRPRPVAGLSCASQMLPAAPTASSAAARAVMRGNRKRDTRPEKRLRSALHARGLRYRVNQRVGAFPHAPRADLVFPTKRLAVFVDGCFWHSCPTH